MPAHAYLSMGYGSSHRLTSTYRCPSATSYCNTQNSRSPLRIWGSGKHGGLFWVPRPFSPLLLSWTNHPDAKATGWGLGEPPGHLQVWEPPRPGPRQHMLGAGDQQDFLPEILPFCSPVAPQGPSYAGRNSHG